MIPNAGVVQSIDANLVDTSGCWLWSTEDIYSQDYAQILVQPISIEVNDVSELRFKAAISTLTIRRGTTPASTFAWSGVVYMVDDPDPTNGGDVTTGTVTSVDLVTPDIFTVTTPPVTSSGFLAFEFNNSPENVVLGDGTVTPLAGIGTLPLYYNSEGPIVLSNSVAETSFAPTATTISANSLLAGNSIKFEGNGQIKWNLINAIDSLTLKFKIGSVILNSTIFISNALKPSIAINQLCNYTIELMVNVNTALSTSAGVSVTGTIELYNGSTTCIYTINSTNTIDTTIDNTVDLTATWAVASVNNYVTIDKLQIIPIFATVNTFDVDSSGTVTSVAMSATGPLSVSGSPITSSGTLALTWAGAATDLILADGTTTLLSNLATTASLSSYLLSSTAATTYLGITAQAADSNKLNGQLASFYATASSLSNYLTTAAAIAGYQPLDSDLTAIAALSTNGFAKRTGTGTWAIDTNTYLTANQSITLSGDVTGSGTTAITTAISAATVTGKLLTGYSVGSNTAIAATDSILGAFQKVQAQIDAHQGTVTSVGLTAPSIFTVSGSPVTSSGSLSFAFNGASTDFLLADGTTTARSGYQEAATALSNFVALGNPGTNGYVLSSTTAGVLSWVAQSGGGGTITLTGDITGSGTSSIATTLASSIAGTHTFTGNIFSGGSVTYIPTAPFMLVNPAAGAMKTQLSLINTGGGAGAGAAIDFYTYDVSGGTNPGLRVCAIDNSYSADFVVYTKAPGAAANALVERFRITNSGVGTLPGGLTCSGGGIGYATGAGGTVTQSTSKSTGVTLNELCGTITLNAASLANATTVSFTFTNSFIAATDFVMIQHSSAGTLGAYNFAVTPAAGSASIAVRNIHTASLSEAIVLRFAVIKAVTA